MKSILGAFLLLGVAAFYVNAASLSPSSNVQITVNGQQMTPQQLLDQLTALAIQYPDNQMIQSALQLISSLIASRVDIDWSQVISVVTTILPSLISILGKRDLSININGQQATPQQLLAQLTALAAQFPDNQMIQSALQFIQSLIASRIDIDWNQIISVVTTILPSLISVLGKRSVEKQLLVQTPQQLLAQLTALAAQYPNNQAIQSALQFIQSLIASRIDIDWSQIISVVTTVLPSLISILGKRDLSININGQQATPQQLLAQLTALAAQYPNNQAIQSALQLVQSLIASRIDIDWSQIISVVTTVLPSLISILG